ncbi:MAG TPA: ankyrin repeat domain-containing protein [Chryseolinea sp.]|nr:ankyrin repeat domain-containing protein [Chryseolinea sp.]
MVAELKSYISNNDRVGLRSLLSKHPHLVNEGIPYDETNPATAHPLHRICDGVFEKRYTDDEAVATAKIFLEFGADVNGGALIEKKDTPLIAAASLGADQVGILYIEHGANIHHAGCHGGTAIHWAAWCGRNILVKRLLEAGADVNKLCIDFRSTPLFWAIHGYKFGKGQNRHEQVECARILLEAGSDHTIPNFEGYKPYQLLDENDRELRDLLR